MLIEFTVSNFKSFRDPTTFSMVAAGLRAREKSLDEQNVARLGGGLRLLKSAAIYGPNASGKSNLVAALRFMRQLVLNSSKETQAAEPTGVEPFLLDERTERAPTSFEIAFLLEGKRYRYGFELTRERVTAEWLFCVPSTREARLFTRDLDDIQTGERFREGRGLEARTRSNALFLSVAAQFNGPVAQAILGWFREFQIVTGLDDPGSLARTLHRFRSAPDAARIVRFLKKLDLGIEALSVETVDTGELAVKTGHRKLGADGRPDGVVTFDLDMQESEGTRKLFALSGPLLEPLETGRPLFVDEFDARLHPLITRALVELFHSPQSNPKHAQLVFTTHDINLLSNSLFRRDQVWFVEKDRHGCSRLHSLAEYRVRNDASFESDYTQGRYGAIPYLGDLAGAIEDRGAP